ncbi:CtsR family transcriptional regulator [Alicyclobacillus sp. SO9]|uniref:CtsR family transcriptional regulator n=1 Tax=Alicyclobacillus sp. SO9 TaxID=2665646 RepID=UPI0018E7BB3C|nr:CtsR family transcriptional regulator [Alicyclobacillus sp. SO9]QQE78555.1 CtsR family transcriptional regulator [Alicyclobacillus sp. SO9]
MGNSISDIIEQHLKRILDESPSGMVELQRSELADVFQCVPSQINYVISTRFSIDHGYIVESKRGGGGYIRIRRLELEKTRPLLLLAKGIGERVSQREAEGLIERLFREELISEREMIIVQSAIHRDVLRLDLPLRDEVRARILTQVLIQLSTMMIQPPGSDE